MKDWLIVICIGIIAVLAFREREHWLSQRALPTPAVAATETLPAPRAAEPSLSNPSVAAQPTPGSPEQTGLAELVAESQRMAVAKYPALATATSEICIRFTFRYKLMVDDHSARLQDPAWPLLLADECALASGLQPVKTHPTPPLSNAPKTASRLPNVARPPVASTPTMQNPPPAPAVAQTLAFHPANVAAPQPPPATDPSADVAPAHPDALPFVTMDAVNQKSANNYTYNWGYYSGWYDISFRQSVGVAINVRNMSRNPAAVNLRWIFFARVTHSNDRFIFAASGKELDLTPGQNASVAADSPMLQRREVNDSWLGQRYLSGSKYEGWLVQLLERGSNRIIKQTGSTSYLEDLAGKTDFSTLLEDYRTKMHTQGGTGLEAAASR